MTMIHSIARRLGLSLLALAFIASAPLALTGCGEEGPAGSSKAEEQAKSEQQNKMKEFYANKKAATPKK